MFVINCPTCPHLIVMNETDDRPPPWCPRCGADLKPKVVPTLPDAARQLWNERPAPSAAVTTNPIHADTLQAEPAAPPRPVPAASRPYTHQYAESPLRPEPVAPPATTGPIPAWAALFAAACGVIPLLTLGGGIPTALGFGGASGCIAVARNPKIDIPSRVILCAGITIGCWVALFVVLGSVMHFFG